MNAQLDHSDHVATSTTYPICYLAHDIAMPMNVGSFFRVADALGIQRIFLSGSSPTPPNPKITRTSRSTEKHVAWKRATDPIDVVRRLKSAGYMIISLELTANSVDIGTLRLTGQEKICLILGSENDGIGQALLDTSDACVHIPMLGHNSSMNVANACAIASWELTRKLQACDGTGATNRG